MIPINPDDPLDAVPVDWDMETLKEDNKKKIGSQHGKKTGAAAVNHLHRKREAMRMRKAGHSYPEIAKKLRMNAHTVYGLVWGELQKISTKLSEDTATVRQLEIQRLDTMLSAIWGRIEEGNERSIETALKIMQRRADLEGLDSPKKAELTLFGGLTNEELVVEARMIGVAVPQELLTEEVIKVLGVTDARPGIVREKAETAMPDIRQSVEAVFESVPPESDNKLPP